MTGDPLTIQLKSIHAWRELAGMLFIPADLVWLVGWYCLLSGIVNGADITFILVVFIISSVFAHLILRILFNWQVVSGLRILMGGFALFIGLWIGENLLIYHRLLSNLPQILEDIWSSFIGLRSLSVEFWALIGMSVIWLRAILYARKPVTQDTVLGRMQFDLIMMLILLVFPNRLSMMTILIGLTIFLAFTLSSLSLARIADINLFRGGIRLPFGFGWLVSVISISAGLAIGSGVVGFMTSSWLTQLVIIIINGILKGFRFIIESLIMPVVFIVWSVMQKLIALVYKPKDGFKIPEMNLEPPEMISGLKPLEIEQSTTEILRSLQPYILSILLILLIFGVVIMLHRKSWKERLTNVDNVISEQLSGSIFKQFQSFISNRFQQMMGNITKRVNIQRASSLLRAARIRRIYHQLELKAARKGFPRPAATTPKEFQSMLVTMFPNQEEDITRITGAYLKVRYGELPESAAEVSVVQDAWERVRSGKKSRMVIPIGS